MIFYLFGTFEISHKLNVTQKMFDSHLLSLNFAIKIAISFLTYILNERKKILPTLSCDGFLASSKRRKKSFSENERYIKQAAKGHISSQVDVI